MESEYLDLLKWVWEIHETYNSDIGVWNASADLCRQEETWRCFGCLAEGKAKWPDWKVVFNHEPHCKYIQFKNLMEKQGTLNDN